MRPPNRLPAALLAAAWLALVAAGFGALAAYGAEAGPAAPAAPAWPAASALPAPAGRPAVVVFAHPRCPCSRATLAELARAMRQARGRLDARVVFAVPEGFDAAWAQAGLWRQAAAIPGVTVHLDARAAEARRFGARTSGHAVVYGADGRQRFSGGLTVARGHEGDNAGRSALVALAFGARPALPTTPVFGCALY